jgi:hypothetical protein
MDRAPLTLPERRARPHLRRGGRRPPASRDAALHALALLHVSLLVRLGAESGNADARLSGGWLGVTAIAATPAVALVARPPPQDLPSSTSRSLSA